LKSDQLEDRVRRKILKWIPNFRGRKKFSEIMGKKGKAIPVTGCGGP
jgi:hypothetical protein